MSLGTFLEPTLCDLLERRVNEPVGDVQVFLRHQEIPYLTATLDGRRQDQTPVEYKTVTPRMAPSWGEPGTDEIPDDYVCQTKHQMLVSGAEHVEVVALFLDEATYKRLLVAAMRRKCLADVIEPSRLRFFTVARNDRFINRQIEIYGELWDRVESRNPPPVTSPTDATILRYLNPEAIGEVALDDAA